MIMKNAEYPLIPVSYRIKFLYTEYPNSMLHCDNLVSHDEYVKLCVFLTFFQNQTVTFFFFKHSMIILLEYFFFL